MAIDLLFKFSVHRQLPKDAPYPQIEGILIQGEEIRAVFTHTRDMVFFTDKRIIALDVQGLTGSKKEYRSFPYKNISSFSIETAGTFDGDSDFKIWVSGVGMFEIKFHKNLNIKAVAQFMAQKLLL